MLAFASRRAICWICCLAAGISLLTGRLAAGQLQITNLGPAVEVGNADDQLLGPIVHLLSTTHALAPYQVGNGGAVVGLTTAPGATTPYGFIQLPGQKAVQIMPLQAPIPGQSIATTAMSVNSKGVVAGASASKPAGKFGRYHAITFCNGQSEDLGVPPHSSFSQTAARAINEAGQVTGIAQQFDASDVVVGERPFLYEHGAMQLLDDPFQSAGGGSSYGVAINDSGQILVIGQSKIGPAASGPAVTFLWDRGTYHQIPMSGFKSIQGLAINSCGAVTGSAAKPGLGHAFLSIYGTTQDLGPFSPATTSCGFAIDGGGRLFGGAAPAASGAFMWEKGQFEDLNALVPPGSNWRLLWVTGCNNQNQIVGIALYRGQEVGFLATLP
jgi:uncharacterized membrane protein